MLHLINIAHKDVRGKADYDTDDVDLEDNAVNDDIGEEYHGKDKANLISELINYIQVKFTDNVFFSLLNNCLCNLYNTDNLFYSH